MKRLFLAIAIGLVSASAFAESIVGTVVGVADGDTIRVLRTAGKQKEEVRVRLFGIDCPESAQPFGAAAKKFTSDAVFRKKVTVEVRGTDQFGRTLGWVLYDDDKRTKRELNVELVQAGLAWWYEYFAPKETKLKEAHEKAQKDKKGLWSEANPVAPWEWKKRR